MLAHAAEAIVRLYRLHGVENGRFHGLIYVKQSVAGKLIMAEALMPNQRPIDEVHL